MVMCLVTACGGDSEGKASPTPSCPKPVPAPAKTITHDSIYLNIVNGSEEAGLAGETEVQMEWRGFNVLDVGNQPLTDSRPTPKTAEIRYGPAGRQIALTVATQVEKPVLFKDDRQDPTVDLVLGPGFELVPVPPPEPKDVEVNVYNTTYKPGLSGEIAGKLRKREFVIKENGNDPGGGYFPKDTAIVRHGPEGEPAARRVALQVKGARLVQDRREGKDIDLVLGSKFEELVPEAQATAPPSKSPKPPAGC